MVWTVTKNYDNTIYTQVFYKYRKTIWGQPWPSWPAPIYGNLPATRKRDFSIGWRQTRAERIAFIKANGYDRPMPYLRETEMYTYGKDETTGYLTGNGYPENFWYQSGYFSKIHLESNCALNTNPQNDPEFTKLYNAAIGQINSKLRRTHIAGETYFEAKKTLQMVLGVQRKLLAGLIALRRFKFKRVYRLWNVNAESFRLRVTAGKIVSRAAARRRGWSPTRAFSNNFLEFANGWIPLFSTVSGAMKAFYDFSHRTDKQCIRESSFVFTSKTTTTTGLTAAESTPWGYPNYPTCGSSRTKVLTKEHYKSCNVVVWYKLLRPAQQGWSTVGLDNPWLTAWELIPISYVADYFVNVSKVLEDLTSWNGKQFLSGQRTFTEKIKCTATPDPSTGAPSSVTSLASPATGYSTRMERFTLGSQPTVSLAFTTNLTTWQVLNMASLIRQRLPGNAL